MTIYEVKCGDTLWKIAQQHGTSVAAICKDNNISIEKADSIFAGQKFNIGAVVKERPVIAWTPSQPAPATPEQQKKPVTVPQYLAKPEPAQAQKTPVYEVPDFLRLVRPQLQKPEPVVTPDATVPCRVGRIPLERHKVEKGENLINIAKKYNLTVEELCRQNNYDIKDAHKLQIGHEFRIDRMPAVQREENYKIYLADIESTGIKAYGLQSVYTVKKGDTLSKIATSFKNQNPHLTSGHIQAVNDLANKNALRIGQKLKIPQMPDETRDQIIPIAIQTARYQGVDPALVLAVIQKESEFNPRATSTALAMGLMQIIPEVAKDHNVGNPYDIVDNVDAGVRHLKYLLERFDGDVELALAGYNAGPVNAAARGKDWSRYSKQTQNYVPTVLEIAQNFREQLKDRVDYSSPYSSLAKKDGSKKVA